MQTFLADQDITLTLRVDDLGVTAAFVEYKIVDQDDAEIVPLTPLMIADSVVEVLVTAAQNALSAGATISARTVILYVMGGGAAAARVTKRQSYALTAENRLPVPSASFQSLLSAEMVANDLIGIDGWIASTDALKTMALMEARNSLVRLRYLWWPEDYQSRVSQTIELNEYWWESMTEGQWASMDAPFKTALKRAQVLEAAQLLAPDQDQLLQIAGVVSVRVGESARTYQSIRSAASKLPVCLRAMQVLGRFLAPIRLTRV